MFTLNSGGKLCCGTGLKEGDNDVSYIECLISLGVVM